MSQYEQKALKVMLSMWPHKPLKDWGDEEHESCLVITKALEQAFHDGQVDEAVKCQRRCEDAVLKEREECAKVADKWAESKSCQEHTDNPCCHVRTGDGIATAIRERTKKGV